jgi:hypothetical protein
VLLSTVILDMASVHLDGLPNLAYSTIHHKFDELKVTEVICIKVLKYLADCPKGPIKKDRSNQMTTQRSTLLPGCTAGHSRRQHWSVIFGSITHRFRTYGSNLRVSITSDTSGELFRSLAALIRQVRDILLGVRSSQQTEGHLTPSFGDVCL